MRESYERLTARVQELESVARAVAGGQLPPAALHDALRADPAAWARGYVDLDGRRFVATGRWGNNLKTGSMSLCFEGDGARRVWVERDGTARED